MAKKMKGFRRIKNIENKKVKLEISCVEYELVGVDVCGYTSVCAYNILQLFLYGQSIE